MSALQEREKTEAPSVTSKSGDDPWWKHFLEIIGTALTLAAVVLLFYGCGTMVNR